MLRNNIEDQLSSYEEHGECLTEIKIYHIPSTTF